MDFGELMASFVLFSVACFVLSCAVALLIVAVGFVRWLI